MSKKYILLDDQSIEIGGTNLTTLSILEDRSSEIFKLTPNALSSYDINDNKDKLWILGNIMTLVNNPNKNILGELLGNTNFIKL